MYKYLESLKLTSKETRILFNERTHDRSNLKVWKDKKSGVIYLDDFYIDTKEYENASYRDERPKSLKTEKPDFEEINDTKRRLNFALKFIAGKRIADFGCGSGNFLRLSKSYCKDLVGIDYEQESIKNLQGVGINCYKNLSSIKDKSLDVITAFHVIEHLPNPIEILTEMKKKLVSGGLIIIEVPNANDILLSTFKNEKFKQFTLWSQHLVLHTRESLWLTLDFVGMKEILIEAVQRYPLSNHLQWLSNGKPEGHKSNLSLLDTPDLNEAYKSSLSRIDATDSLIAIAKSS